MAWTNPQYSRAHVNAAGQFLVDRRTGRIRSLNEAFRIVNNWRSSHAFPLNTMRSYLHNQSTAIDSASIVAQRIKRLPSIIHKLHRLDWLTLSAMQDVGGCRAVLRSVRQVEHLVNAYHGSRIKHELLSENDYIASPKPSGYRSHHLIYRYFSDRNDTYNGLKIEIQIRSRLQHARATAVETMGTYTRQSLKSSQGEQDWLRFFALMSTVIAFREGSPKVPETPDGSRELISELRHYASELDVINRLTAYRVLTRHIVPRIGDARYFLVQLEFDKRTIMIKRFSSNDLDAASSQYLDAERSALSFANSDAVLVSVESVQSLERAFPNYFLDTSRFLQEVRRH